MEIRPETPKDYECIYALTNVAFEFMPYSDGTEAECINKLRADGDLKLSLVAVEQGDIVGHIAFSPAFIAGISKGWFGLGPVSVLPGRQRAGIGSMLINSGIETLKKRKASGCVLIGNPNYYGRFGFVGDGCISYRGLSDEIVQWMSFDGMTPKGIVKFSPGLE